ncbi:MAG: glycosyltransferase family 4 protein [Acidobacteria bacterium]|nr:glycosyltransferase family 4 protein [Acidobacteriota bacterium]
MKEAAHRAPSTDLKLRKRVLQFFGSFNQGGSERQAAALTRSLHEDGTYEVFAATLSNDGVLKRDVDSIGLGDIPEFPLTSFYNANFVGQVRACANFLRINKIDLVHTHDFYTNVFGIAAASLARVPARIASKRETAGMRTRAQNVIERIAFGRAHAIVANSDAVRKALISRGVPDEKIALIYNGIDHTGGQIKRDRDAVRAKFGIPDGGSWVTLVANLRHEVKNIPMLLKAAKIVLEQADDAHFIVAGEGGLRTELEGLAVRRGVAANVHFIGRCDDTPELLAASDICVLTSTAEGFSNSILEYMAAGKPVVVTDVGGAREAVDDGVNGYIVASDDHSGMANRLLELLADEGRAKQMGAAGRHLVAERFSRETQLAKTIELYSRLLP